MTAHRLTILWKENQNQPLPFIMQVLIENGIIKMADARAYVLSFRAQQDISFNVPDSSLKKTELGLSSLNVIYTSTKIA